MRACMGGWCSKREQCPHYVAEGEPAERLCIRGRDGVRLVDAGPFRVIHADVFSGQEIGAASTRAHLQTEIEQ